MRRIAATSAFDTVTQRAGVCRDFAHLGIAFCRALSIPARYFAGYACNMQPPDFHACFEACIGNRWFIFDPTRRAALNGLVRIATGRDAADAFRRPRFSGPCSWSRCEFPAPPTTSSPFAARNSRARPSFSSLEAEKGSGAGDRPGTRSGRASRAIHVSDALGKKFIRKY